MPHRQLVSRQRSGLVAGNDRTRPQPLDRGQEADNDVAPGHAPDRDTERNRQCDRQTFRNCRHRERRRDQKDFRHRDTPGEFDHSQQHDHDRNDDGDRARKPAHTHQQRWRHLSGGAHSGCDLPDLGRRANRRYYSAATAARYHGARVHHRDARGRHRLRRQRRPGILGDRSRFAGQHRFVDFKVPGFEQPDVGRDQQTPFDRHQIARHQVLRRNAITPAAPAHHRPHRDQVAQLFGFGTRFPFLKRADCGVDLQNRKDKRRIEHLADGQRHRRSRQQEINERTSELAQIDSQQPGRRRLGQNVGPECALPGGGFGTGKTVRGRAERGCNVGSRKCVPRARRRAAGFRAEFIGGRAHRSSLPRRGKAPTAAAATRAGRFSPDS